MTDAARATTRSMLGPASADLWLRSSAPPTPTSRSTITEVRPDGKETYVQSGWLRASHRTLDARRRRPTLAPGATRTPAADAAPLPDDEFAPVRVPLFPFGHVVPRGLAGADRRAATGRQPAALGVRRARPVGAT